ncbi:MAG: site-specific DNA-methyltransferase [Bacteroidales bacterium]|nr:site-specific DNA-methyltransferase [Bacteroidales bacterium]
MIKDIKAQNENVKLTDGILAKLHADFPQCFNNEGKFDLEKFRQLIEPETDITKEGYGLDYLGKNYANLICCTESETVIQPDLEHNAKPENAESQNIYISGDNLDALKHLLKSYAGKIKCIYIDPPYNSGSDGFVYNDNFNFTVKNLQTKLGISEEKAKRILDLCTRGSSSHSAWLMFMAPRLMIAQNLLKEDGVIFISIDDNEQANLKLLCDSVFGEENFVATFPWRKRTAKSDVPFGVSQDYEWIICYAKTDLSYSKVDGKERKYFETEDFPNKPWRIHDLSKQTTASERPNSFFTIVNPQNGQEYPANPNRTWAITRETFSDYYAANRIIFPGDYDFLNITKPVLRYWKEDDERKAGDNFGKIAVSTNLPISVGMSLNGTKDIDELFSSKTFSFPKPVALIKYIISTILDEDDLILDFFSGSATTAHAVMKLNSEDGGKRKFIMVQIPEPTPKDSEANKAGYDTIDQIGQERIRRAAKKIKEDNPLFADDLGFRHYTLQNVDQNTLDKMETFDPNGSLLGDGDILKQFGKETVLATWLLHDGYGFGEAKPLKISEYTAYHCGSHLYFIEGDNFDENAVTALIDKYNGVPDFNPQNIVLFGYSFSFTQTEMLKKNLNTLQNSTKELKFNIDIRY